MTTIQAIITTTTITTILIHNCMHKCIGASKAPKLPNENDYAVLYD